MSRSGGWIEPLTSAVGAERVQRSALALAGSSGSVLVLVHARPSQKGVAHGLASSDTLRRVERERMLEEVEGEFEGLVVLGLRVRVEGRRVVGVGDGDEVR